MKSMTKEEIKELCEMVKAIKDNSHDDFIKIESMMYGIMIGRRTLEK